MLRGSLVLFRVQNRLPKAWFCGVFPRSASGVKGAPACALCSQLYGETERNPDAGSVRCPYEGFRCVRGIISRDGIQRRTRRCLGHPGWCPRRDTPNQGANGSRCMRVVCAAGESLASMFQLAVIRGTPFVWHLTCIVRVLGSSCFSGASCRVFARNTWHQDLSHMMMWR